jgi:Tol biopolymer transport system component/predicted Ser/Thr protein kinase
MDGQTVSHYRIGEKLGEGGMGVVYKATDTRLDRTVAVKFLPQHLTSDAAAKSRFVREAKTASALDHPNILTIHDIGETEDGQLFIVMAYYEGRTLRELLGDGRLDVARAVNLVSQVAAGLGKAHSQGIVHRDIKPDNIIVTDDDHVKILDFGLAKLIDRTRVTEAGMTVGTVAYMSPEQAGGRDADARSDVFSTGLVLYELLAGKPAFQGHQDLALLYAITNAEPEPIGTVRDDVPPALEETIAKALEKDPTSRHASGEALKRDLDAVVPNAAGSGGAAGAPTQRRGKRPLAYAVLTLVLAAALVAVTVTVRRQQVPDSQVRDSQITDSQALDSRVADSQAPGGAFRKASAVTLHQITFAAGVEEFPSFSRDGSQLVYCGEVAGFRQLFIKSIDGGEERQLTQSESDNIQPVWSPDGATILFTRSNTPGGKLQPGDIFGEYGGGDIWAYDVVSGTEARVVENAFGPSYAPDGARIAFDASWSGTRRIWTADDRGRNPLQVSFDESEAVSHISPRWSPDGKKIVFQSSGATNFDIRVLDMRSRALVSVTDDAFQDLNPDWSARGDEIFFSSYRSGGMNVWRVLVDTLGAPVGPARQLTTGAGEDVQIAAASTGGRIAISILKLNADLWRLPLDPATLTQSGAPQPVVETTREDSRGAWSPNGKHIAFNSDRRGNMNIWVHSLEEGRDRQLTEGPGGDYQPTWSPGGDKLVFFSSRAGNPDIWVVDVASAELSQLTQTPSIDINPFYSPNGRYIAYQSDVGGRREAWVVNADGHNGRALTRGGVTGHFMLWLPDSEALIFRSPSSGGYSILKVGLDGEEVEEFVRVTGGHHMSFGPDHARVVDVVGHKTVWVTNVSSGDASVLFESDDPSVRIDYPVCSPDGRWLLFDRVRPQGGDIWLVDY